MGERREHLKKLKLCFCCGLPFHGVPWKTGGRNSPCNWDRKLDPVKCQGDSCEKGATTCLEHAEEANTTEELKAWLDKNNVSTTLNTIMNFTSCGPHAEPLPTKVSKRVRSKLQSGETHSNFSNTELKDFFTNDLLDEGDKNPVVHSVPEGEVSFVFGLIQGKKSSVQVFFDTGCNCAIVRDSIPEKEFKSSLLKPGQIDIDVATGVKVQASGE